MLLLHWLLPLRGPAARWRWRGRCCSHALLGRSVGTIIRRCLLNRLTLRPRSRFSLGLFNDWRRLRSDLGRRRCPRAFIKISRHALLKARHAFGKTALRSPGSFFLVSRKSNKSVGSILGTLKLPQPTSAPDNMASTVAAINRLTRLLFRFSVTLASTLSTQLLAPAGSKACNASARERMLGGVCASAAIASSHCRVAVVSLLRQADSASNSRAVWR